MDSGNMLLAFQQMLYLTLGAVTIIVLPSLVVGLVVAIFQAATQINEMTLSFLPKLFIILILVALLAPWLMQHLVNFTQKLVTDMPYTLG